jgi:hypothetical protein
MRVTEITIRKDRLEFSEVPLANPESWGESGIALVAPGAEPRAILRRTLEPGVIQELEVETGSAAGKGDMEGEGVALRRRYRVAIETEKVETDGSSATIGVVFHEELPTAPEPDAAAPNTSALPTEAAKGAKATASLHAKRHGIEVHFPVPEETAKDFQALEHALHGLNLVLPEAAVGEGAQWTVVETIERGGQAFRQRTTYELVGIKGSKIDLRTRVEQRYTPGQGPAIVWPPLESARASWDLRKAAPTHAQRLTTQAVMVLGQGGYKTTWVAVAETLTSQ